MFKETHSIEDIRLLSYEVGSADLWYSGLCVRDVSLCLAPDYELMIYGKLPDSGNTGSADLSQIILEYALSVQDFRNPARAFHAADCFGGRLGRNLAHQLDQLGWTTATSDLVCSTLHLIFRSMAASYTIYFSSKRIDLELDECPLHRCAQQTGIHCDMAIAHHAFRALVESVLFNLAQEWSVAGSNRGDSDPQLRHITLVKL